MLRKLRALPRLRHSKVLITKRFVHGAGSPGTNKLSSDFNTANYPTTELIPSRQLSSPTATQPPPELSTQVSQATSPTPIIAMVDASKKIAPTEATLGYTFTNKLLCVEGLQMAGAPGYITLKGSMHRVEKNTRLAVLGDAMMSSVFAEKWFEHRDGRGQLLSKGDWDQLRQQLLSNGNLNAVGRAHGIDGAILKNAGLRQVSNEMVATTMEAIVGAAHVDVGGEDLGVVRKIMEKLGLFGHELLRGDAQADAVAP